MNDNSTTTGSHNETSDSSQRFFRKCPWRTFFDSAECGTLLVRRDHVLEAGGEGGTEICGRRTHLWRQRGSRRPRQTIHARSRNAVARPSRRSATIRIRWILMWRPRNAASSTSSSLSAPRKSQGSSTVNTFVGRDWTKSVDENWPRFLKIWRPLIAFAEDHGIRIGIENCPMLFTRDEWPGGKRTLATTPVIWRRIRLPISPRKNFGLNYDPSHFVLQHMDPAPASPEISGEDISHFHAKDVKLNRAGSTKRESSPPSLPSGIGPAFLGFRRARLGPIPRIASRNRLRRPRVHRSRRRHLRKIPRRTEERLARRGKRPAAVLFHNWIQK